MTFKTNFLFALLSAYILFLIFINKTIVYLFVNAIYPCICKKPFSIIGIAPEHGSCRSKWSTFLINNNRTNYE